MRNVHSKFQLGLNVTVKVICRSSLPKVFLRKDVMKICFEFTGEYPCLSLIEITPQHGCSPLNLLHIFITPFYKNTFGGLLLNLSNFELHIYFSVRLYGKVQLCWS